MDDEVQAHFRRDFELLLKDLDLPRLDVLVVRRRAAARTRQPEVIQPRLADGHDLGMLRQLRSSARKSLGARTASLGCQPTTANTPGNRSASVTARALLSKSVPMLTNRVMPAAAALDELRQFVGEVGVIQMRVRVVKLGHE